MTPFATLTARLGWSCPEVARRLGCSRSTCDRWHSGINTRGNPAPCPDRFLKWLLACIAAVDAVPVPF